MQTLGLSSPLASNLINYNLIADNLIADNLDDSNSTAIIIYIQLSNLFSVKLNHDQISLRSSLRSKNTRSIFRNQSGYDQKGAVLRGWLGSLWNQGTLKIGNYLRKSMIWVWLILVLRNFCKNTNPKFSSIFSQCYIISHLPFFLYIYSCVLTVANVIYNKHRTNFNPYLKN